MRYTKNEKHSRAMGKRKKCVLYSMKCTVYRINTVELKKRSRALAGASLAGG